MWLGNADTVRRIIARLIEECPAVALIAGDFIYRPVDEETQPEARAKSRSREKSWRLYSRLTAQSRWLRRFLQREYRTMPCRATTITQCASRTT
jgi:hypothetical protein